MGTYEAYGKELVGRIGGGGGGGHVIQNGQGTDMPQEEKLQFPDSHVSDDSTNGRTVVENVKEVDPADYASTTDEGIIVTDDGDDALIGPVSDDYVEVIADGEKTWATLLNELWLEIDSSKVTDNALFVYDTGINRVIHNLYLKTNNAYNFSLTRTNNSNISNGTVMVVQSNSKMYEGVVSASATTLSNISSDVPTNGTKITLYYGNKKAVVDLQTTANRCLYDSNITVKQKIDTNDASVIKHHPSLPMIYLGYDSTGQRLLVYNEALEFIGSIPVNVGA